MGSKQNPGAYDCYANALADEPMFVLLARDPSAPHLVRQWAMCRHMEIQYGLRPVSDNGAAGEAYGCARAMEKWRTANDGRWRTEQAPVPPDVNSDLLAACKAQHEAIDTLFAMLIVATRSDRPSESGMAFMPSKSGQPWEALVAGNAAIAKAEGREPGEVA
jgi:hypothetical protein